MWQNQIFSLIQTVDGKNIVQNIIVCDNYEVANQIARLSFGDDAYAIDTTLIPVSVGCEHRDGSFYDIETLIQPNPTDSQKITDLESKTNEIKHLIIPTIDTLTCTVDELKVWQINQNKKNLREYLENNPLFSKVHKKEGAYYSITDDKQKYLSQMIMMAQLASQSGLDYQPSWNETGEECTYDWTLIQLQELAFEMEQVVRPLVSKQQSIEKQINACVNKSDILAINIEF